MIIEQIRYFVDEDQKEQLLAVRREVARLRSQLDLPAGLTLVADPPAEDGASVVWQCAYEDDNQMGEVTTALMGNDEYESTRDRLAVLVQRVELELYTVEDDGVELDSGV